MKYFALLGALLIALGCGSKDHATAYVPPEGGGDGGRPSTGSHAGAGGRTGTSGSGGSAAGDEAGAAGAEPANPLAPSVTITAPLAASDPNADPVVIDDQVTVVCSVTASTDPSATKVNASTVKIAAYDADGVQLKSSTGTPTANADEYSAPFVVADLPSGPISFQCTGSDSSSPVNTASTTVKTLLDRGPTIDIGEPMADSAHNLLGPMDVEFKVTAVPIAAGDKQAGVSAVSLAVGGTKIPVVDKGNGTYQVTVDFTDKALYASPPSGKIPVVITATNGRKNPGKAAHSLTYNIVVDGVGPAITLSSPEVGSVIGRASLLAFTITDSGSGVDRATVAVSLDKTAYVFSATDNQWTWDDATGTYTFKVGAQLLASTDSQVTVNVLASDKAGNPSMGNSRLFYLDNQPPTVDLDPPGVWETRQGATPDVVQCSDFFDPLGDGTQKLEVVNNKLVSTADGSPNDLITITNFGRFRALVWDETNFKLGQTDKFYSLTDKQSVRLYIQPDPTSPLLADDDGDGTCDEIWTGSAPHQRKPTDKPLPFLAMSPLVPTPAGNPAWGDADSAVPLAIAPYCQLPPDKASFVRLCGPTGQGVSDMSVVIRHPVPSNPFEPVIYAIEPNASATDVECAGSPWDVEAAISMAGLSTKLGWVCMAARALDNVGNPGISSPLRLCLDDGTNPDRCKGVAPPSCTDNCTAPPHFVSQAVKHN